MSDMTLRAGSIALRAADPLTLVDALLGPGYSAAAELDRAAWRERYCLAQLVFRPDARLDPRTDLSFLRSLAEAGVLELGEVLS